MVTVNNIPPIIFDALTVLAGALDSAVYPPLNIQYKSAMYNLKYKRTDGDFIGISESLKSQVNMLFKATAALNKHRISIYKMKWHVEKKGAINGLYKDI